jgi:co-chaperonin GroES (HSP10)
MTFPIQPLQDIVIVEQLTQDTSAGGIVLTGDHRKFPAGQVVAVGPGRVYSNFMDATGNQTIGQLVPTTVKTGDHVLFGKYQSGGEPIEIEGGEYAGRVFLMCREGDLGGVMPEAVKVRLAVA